MTVHLLRNAAGLEAELLSHGALRRLQLASGLLLNLFPGNELEGGPANVWLRRRDAGGDDWRAVPVRAYHGDQDTVVPLAPHVACVDALRAAGGKASLTIYPGVGHDSWTPAYNDPELLPWLLSQRQV